MTDPTISQDASVDSGMDAETVALAEWLWTNLPTGPRKWTGLPTHEKALVCHTVARFEAHLRTPAPMLMTQEWLDKKVDADPVAEVEAYTPAGEAGEMPFAYAYRYPHYSGGTVIRFSSGEEINGSKPIEAIPLFTRLATDTEAMRLLMEARDCIEGEFGAIKLVQRIDALAKGRGSVLGDDVG